MSDMNYLFILLLICMTSCKVQATAPGESWKRMDENTFVLNTEKGAVVQTQRGLTFVPCENLTDGRWVVICSLDNHE